MQILYAIKDDKVGAFANLFPAKCDADAVRSLQTAMRDPQIQLSMYPEDFSLWKIGTFNQENGRFIQDDSQPVFVVAAVSFAKIQAQEKEVGNGKVQ